jgi:hypothetical protein
MPEFIAMLGSAPGPRLGQVPTYSYMGQMPDFSYQSIAKYSDLRGLGQAGANLDVKFPFGEMDDSAFSSYNMVWDAMKFAYSYIREKGTDPAAIGGAFAAASNDKAKELGAWALAWMKKNGRDADLMALASANNGNSFAKAVLSQYDKFVPTLSMFQGTSRAKLAAIAAKRIQDNIFTTAADLNCLTQSCADLHFGALMAAAVGAQYASENAPSRKEFAAKMMETFQIVDGPLIATVPAADKPVAAPIVPPHYFDMGLKIFGIAAAAYLGYAYYEHRKMMRSF